MAFCVTRAKIARAIPMNIIGEKQTGARRFREQRHLNFQFFRQPDIVLIQQGNPFTRGVMQGGIARGLGAAVGLAQNSDATIRLRKFLRERMAVVAGTIINNNDFKILKSLLSN